MNVGIRRMRVLIALNIIILHRGRVMTKLFIKISKPGQLERPQSFILTWEYIMQLVF